MRRGWISESCRVGFCAMLVLLVATAAQAQDVVLRGVTVVDTTNSGNRSDDLENAVIVVRAGRIVAIGGIDSVAIPEGVPLLEVDGKFVIPGLIDGHASGMHQAAAVAYLRAGITRVADCTWGWAGGQTAPPDPPVVPAYDHPRCLGREPLLGYDDEEIARHCSNDNFQCEELRLNGERRGRQRLTELLQANVAQGGKVVFVQHNVWPDQLDHIVRESRRLGLGIQAVLGHTHYAYAARAGAQSFAMMPRYLSELVPPSMQLAYADEPYGESARRMRAWLSELSPSDPGLIDFAQLLAAQHTALMPAMVMNSNLFPGHVDPALDVLMQGLVVDGLDPPGTCDPQSQAHPRSGTDGNAMLNLHRVLVQHQVPLLAASGTPRLCTFPGISLLRELEIFQQLGLSPRQALASATTNYSNAYHWNDLGLIAVGARADLVVLDLDPRQSIAALRGPKRVFIEGREVSLAAPVAPSN